MIRALSACATAFNCAALFIDARSGQRADHRVEHERGRADGTEFVLGKVDEFMQPFQNAIFFMKLRPTPYSREIIIWF